MLRDEHIDVVPTWAQEEREPATKRERYREIDQQLRAIAQEKTRLAVEEAKWLREAEQHRVWRKLGFSTALEYLEDLFGYSPRKAKERLRVAKELAELTGLEAELRNGTLHYSAARELSRVMTRATEAQWLARARGKNLRDIELLVAGHKKGDTPDSPKDPALMTTTLMLKLVTRQQALLEQARAMFEAERGAHLELEELIEALCMRALEGGSAPNDLRGPSAKAPRPAHQIMILKSATSQAVQEGRGRLLPLSADELARVECDAEVVREEDIIAAQESGKRRPAPTLTIPKKIRDVVWRRDEGRCRFPGCRATVNLALHHLEFQMHGGEHKESNLVLLCDGHHKLLHEGIVTITGRAPDALAFTRDGRRLVDPSAPAERQAAAELRAGAERQAAAEPRADAGWTGRSIGEGHALARPKTRSRFDDVVKLELAKQALKQLGFKAGAARRALEDALTHVGRGADIPTLVNKVLSMNRDAAIDDDDADIPTLAKRALAQSGYPTAIAAKAVEAACAHVGPATSLETLIIEAFRRCADR